MTYVNRTTSPPIAESVIVGHELVPVKRRVRWDCEWAGTREFVPRSCQIPDDDNRRIPPRNGYRGRINRNVGSLDCHLYIAAGRNVCKADLRHGVDHLSNGPGCEPAGECEDRNSRK